MISMNAMHHIGVLLSVFVLTYWGYFFYCC